MADATDGTALLVSLVETVPALTKRCQEALDLSELIARGKLPASPEAAFVIPTGLRPHGEGDAGAGAYTQSLDELFAVILVVKTSGDVSGAKTRPKLNKLIWDVVYAVVGEDNDDDDDDLVGVFRLQRSQTLSLNAGAAIVQIDFAIQRQLRKA